MTPWLMFLTWFLLGTLIGSFIAHRRYNGGYWSIWDEAEWWLHLIRFGR